MMKRYAGWLAVLALGECAGCGADTMVSAGSTPGASVGPNPTPPPAGSGWDARTTVEPTPVTRSAPLPQATTPESPQRPQDLL